MEKLLFQLQSTPLYKDALKVWCRKNSIKVSFLINMTLSKSRSIHGKLTKTYQKGFGKSKLRWLENELKLFHFILLAVSTIHETLIENFSQKEWPLLQQAFPNKDKCILQYEAKYFVASNDALKRKWETEQDSILTQIVNQTEQDHLRWNEIAVGLFIKSDKQYFRSTKQCRERWLNHLDDSIKHQRWNVDEDKKLIQNVLVQGKKWSQIMRNFANHRTEHMIKNRYISLVLQYRKVFPMVQDEDEIVKLIAVQMDIQATPEEIQRQKHQMEKKLRPRKLDEKESHQEKFLSKIQEKQVSFENRAQFKEVERLPICPIPSNQIGSIQTIEENCYSHNMLPNLPTPTFMSPLPFMNCNSFANNYAMFQCYMNYFQPQYNNN